MRLKASLLVTASGMTLVLVMVGLLHSTSHQSTEAEPTIDALSLVTPLLEPAPALPPKKATTSAVGVPLDHPGQADGNTKEPLNRRFSVDESLYRVKQIDQLLARFHTTTTAKQVPPGKQPATVGDRSNSDTRKQAHNWTGAVTGTLKKQDYEIKKLELALAKKQFKDGEIPKTTLVQKQANYQKAAREFKAFLNSSGS